MGNTNKRPNGDGTVKQTVSGSYHVRIQIDGHRHRETFPTHKEAEKWLRDLKNKRDKGQVVPPHKQTLAQYLTDWLPVKLAELKNGRPYKASYKVALRLNVKTACEHEIGTILLRATGNRLTG